MLLSHFVHNHWMLLADVIASWLFMVDVLAIVADVKATVFLFVENHN